MSWRFAGWWLLALRLASQAAGTNSAAGETHIIEVAGSVEYLTMGRTNWQAATVALSLQPGDRLRTRELSRAAVQFSDRSILRLGGRTTLEIQPPRRAEKRRFRLLDGLLYFFNREKPAEIEFETPVVSGAIRGTEFVLAANEASGTSRLALLDGRVELTSDGAAMSLQGGEQAEWERGAAPRKTAILEADRRIQWALYYPAVVFPGDLNLMRGRSPDMDAALEAYNVGDLLAAQAVWAPGGSGDEDSELFRAALNLAVGGVEAAAEQLARSGTRHPVAGALREIIAVVGGESVVVGRQSPTTATEWLARSYALQAQFHLREAREAARQAARLAPAFGFAHVRVAELEIAFGEHAAALAALDRALRLSPRLAQAHALEGFVRLEQNQGTAALAAFDRAIALDSALGNAWLGRGLALFRLHRRGEALRSVQAAAALEPRRALFRAYLGKAFSAAGEFTLAEKDYRLGRELDSADPTPWFYSALGHWDQLRPNAAIRELQHAGELNDNQQIFHSRLLLERDRAIRSADLAAIYRDSALSESGLHAAARSVTEDYVNASGHLFLSRSYQDLEDVNRFDLRWETARQSELLVANLLAPVGEGNLSQVLSQQEYLQYFDPRPLGASSYTEYQSTGDWLQVATVFGTLDDSDYALDFAYESRHGQAINDWRERRDVSLQFKHRLDAQDEVYFQLGTSDVRSGDLARHFDVAEAHPDLRVEEQQLPNVFLGWHRAWASRHQTLVLLSRAGDSLRLEDAGVNELFFRPSVSHAVRVSPLNDFRLQFASEFQLYSAEWQEIWQTERNTLVVGTRWQAGDVTSESQLERDFTGVLSRDRITEPMFRSSAYVYDTFQVARPLRLVAGLSYDRLTHPSNSDAPPLSPGRSTEVLPAPKVGFLLTPWRGAHLHGAYTKSLGGLFFDNSVRLEPSQVAGFNQAFRSLVPESTAGIVPGTEFRTVSLGLDQTLTSGTHFGLEVDQLRSEGDRTIGVFAGPLFAPLPGSASRTSQQLSFEERNLSCYAVQLLGEGVSIGVRYHWREARLDERFPDVPVNAVDLAGLQSIQRSTLHQVGLSLNYQHPAGFFAGWESAWYAQDNSGYDPVRSVDPFWMHHLTAGYRFPGHRAELRAGLMNLAGHEARLNPLTSDQMLPRGRVWTLSLRLHF